MKLFLTSTASNVMEKIVPALGKSAETLRVAFIPTASDPYNKKPWLEADRKSLANLGFKVGDIDLKNVSQQELHKSLRNSDIIFVAGGNSFYLMEKVISSGFDKLLKGLLKQGVIYIGSSAGSVICGPSLEPFKIFDDPCAAQLENNDGLKLVDFVVLPHFGKEKYDPYHQKVISEYNNKYKLITLTDQQFVKVENNSYKVI